MRWAALPESLLIHKDCSWVQCGAFSINNNINIYLGAIWGKKGQFHGSTPKARDFGGNPQEGPACLSVFYFRTNYGRAVHTILVSELSDFVVKKS